MTLLHVVPIAFVFLSSITAACSQQQQIPPPTMTPRMTSSARDTATLAGGCFWCVEAVFQRLDGVDTVISGYTGGKNANPTYEEICTGQTGHAEACQVIFDPAKVSYADILHVFFTAHDPTTLNRQGNDVGTQYRSAIFYHNSDQKLTAEEYVAQLTNAKTWADPIVTELAPATTFYPAENYHQDYYNQNGSQPYCAFVVRPKVEKFLKQFGDRVKPSYK